MPKPNGCRRRCRVYSTSPERDTLPTMVSPPTSLARREGSWGFAALPWRAGRAPGGCSSCRPGSSASCCSLPGRCSPRWARHSPIWCSFRPGATRFIGLDNWARLVRDPLVLQSLLVTAKFLLIALPISLGLPLLMAVLVNSTYLVGKPLFRALFFLPGIDSRCRGGRYLAGRVERPDGVDQHGVARAWRACAGLDEPAGVGSSPRCH